MSDLTEALRKTFNVHPLADITALAPTLTEISAKLDRVADKVHEVREASRETERTIEAHTLALTHEAKHFGCCLNDGKPAIKGQAFCSVPCSDQFTTKQLTVMTARQLERDAARERLYEEDDRLRNQADDVIAANLAQRIRRETLTVELGRPESRPYRAQMSRAVELLDLSEEENVLDVLVAGDTGDKMSAADRKRLRDRDRMRQKRADQQSYLDSLKPRQDDEDDEGQTQFRRIKA